SNKRPPREAFGSISEKNFLGLGRPGKQDRYLRLCAVLENEIGTVFGPRKTTKENCWKGSLNLENDQRLCLSITPGYTRSCILHSMNKEPWCSRPEQIIK